MIKSSRLEEDKNIENIIDVRNLFRLEKLKKTKTKKTNDVPIKVTRNLFRFKKESKAIKCKILTDIRNLSEHEEEDYYKLVRVNNYWSNNYIEYKSKGDRKTLSVKKYLDEIRPYSKDIK